MTRFTDIDLARLPALPLGQDTFEAIRLARLAEVQARLDAAGIPFDVGMLRTDPLAYAMVEPGAFRELLAIMRHDDAIRAVLLASSWGTFLDHLGASQVPPVRRKTLVPANPATGAADLMEEDDDYRRRIQLAPETLSTAGPEGGYLFFALDTPGVKMAWPYGPMSFGGTIATPFTGLGEIHVPIVAAAGDGTASPELVAAVQAELRSDDRRPIADFVTVAAAEIVHYSLHAVLRVGAGADVSLVRTEAGKRLAAQALRQHRPGAAALAQQFYGAAYVADAAGAILVEEVVLTTDGVTPFADINAAPITPGTPAAAYRAPFCTAITVETEVVDD